MNGGIGADEFLGPVRIRACAIIILKSLIVVCAFVTKAFAESVYPRGFLDEDVPIVMSDLVAEMAKERAVGFMHRDPGALALDIIRFGDVHGDHTILVTGESSGPPGRIGDKTKLQPFGGVLELGDNWQIKFLQ